MLTGVIEAQRGFLGGYIHPELMGRRVLVTGLSSDHGVDVARVFADHGCRLVLQIADPTPETDALLEVLSESAEEIAVGHADIADPDGAVRFAQTAAQAYGGLDVVVNLIAFDGNDIAAARTVAEVERAISSRFEGVLKATRVVANRMGLTWSEGVIVNVLCAPPKPAPSEAAMIAVARSILAAMTRREAVAWADQRIRVNAIASSGSFVGRGGASDGELQSGAAALALFLASDRGRDVTGLVLDPTSDVRAL